MIIFRKPIKLLKKKKKFFSFKSQKLRETQKLLYFSIDQVNNNVVLFVSRKKVVAKFAKFLKKENQTAHEPIAY